jgi:hypothetical protein
MAVEILRGPDQTAIRSGDEDGMGMLIERRL